MESCSLAEKSGSFSKKAESKPAEYDFPVRRYSVNRPPYAAMPELMAFAFSPPRSDGERSLRWQAQQSGRAKLPVEKS